MRANEIMRSECGNYCHEDCPFLYLGPPLSGIVKCTYLHSTIHGAKIENLFVNTVTWKANIGIGCRKILEEKKRNNSANWRYLLR